MLDIRDSTLKELSCKVEQEMNLLATWEMAIGEDFHANGNGPRG